MTRKKGKLREFERDNRVINIEENQKARRERIQIMREQQEEQEGVPCGEKRRSKKYRKKHKISVTRIVLIVVIFAVVFYFGNSLLKILSLSSQKQKAEEYNKKLLNQKEILSMRLENISSDNYIEEKAREKFRMLKPGELLFIFNDDEKASQEDDENNSKDSETEEGETGE